MSTTEKEEIWEEKFDRWFLDNDTDLYPHRSWLPKELKAFIRSTLSHQQEELIRKIEGLRKHNHQEYCSLHNIPLTFSSCGCWKDYNWALDDFINLIKEQSNGK